MPMSSTMTAFYSVFLFKVHLMFHRGGFFPVFQIQQDWFRKQHNWDRAKRQNSKSLLNDKLIWIERNFEVEWTEHDINHRVNQRWGSSCWVFEIDAPFQDNQHDHVHEKRGRKNQLYKSESDQKQNRFSTLYLWDEFKKEINVLFEIKGVGSLQANSKCHLHHA